MNTTLFALAIAFTLVSLGVFNYERRAKSCRIHQRWVGRVAVSLGVLCAVVAVLLLIAAYLVAATP